MNVWLMINALAGAANADADAAAAAGFSLRSTEREGGRVNR